MPTPKISRLELALTDGTASEVSKQFLQGMVNRMAVIFHKYGKVPMLIPTE